MEKSFTHRPEDHSNFYSLELEHTQKMIVESIKLSFPAWPLQNSVAVNPFWFLRDQRFETVSYDLKPIYGASLLPALSQYREKYLVEGITEESLRKAFQDMEWLHAESPSFSVDETLERIQQASIESDDNGVCLVTFSEWMASDAPWDQFVSTEIGKHASAYFDHRQALAPYPWKALRFWNAWLEIQKYDSSVKIAGLGNPTQKLHSVLESDALEAIHWMLDKMGISSYEARISYLKRLTALGLGWASQFRYLEWQRSLGYNVTSPSTTEDLIAVRLAYEYLLFEQVKATDPSLPSRWRAELQRSAEIVQNQKNSKDHLMRALCQRAWEYRYQQSVAARIKTKETDAEGLKDAPPATVKMVFCIDVRSEVLRRHIERESKGRIETSGFAGFFGLPLSYSPSLDLEHSPRLPVLLSPKMRLQNTDLAQRSEKSAVETFLKKLRKEAMASFTYVELFGVVYVGKILKKAFQIAWNHGQKRKLPQRFIEKKAPIHLEHLEGECGTILTLADKVERLKGIMMHLGWWQQGVGLQPLPDLVVFVGHGSATTNNAFGSSLDCGACGGNAGDINARVLAQLLNDNQVRAELKKQGIEISQSTWFLAAVHETVTDELHPLDLELVPERFKKMLNSCDEVFERAKDQAQRERLGSLSSAIDPDSSARSLNWAEVRPEWGLAGNASFIVAPRDRTLSSDLSGRAFLHDYNWKKDEKNDFQTLELIMTAPMVVTNWINMQYFASTVVPSVYGAGNKVLHNVVCESGVVEGNGGDLKVGLSHQSLHDGRKNVHEALRLSVFIEAPKVQIERVIQKHSVVRDLVNNGWLHLLYLDSETGKVERRVGENHYVEA